MIIVASFLLGMIAGSYRSTVVSSTLVLFISVAFCFVIANQFSGAAFLSLALALLAYNVGLMVWAVGCHLFERLSNVKNI